MARAVLGIDLGVAGRGPTAGPEPSRQPSSRLRPSRLKTAWWMGESRDRKTGRESRNVAASQSRAVLGPGPPGQEPSRVGAVGQARDRVGLIGRLPEGPPRGRIPELDAAASPVPGPQRLAIARVRPSGLTVAGSTRLDRPPFDRSSRPRSDSPAMRPVKSHHRDPSAVPIKSRRPPSPKVSVCTGWSTRRGGPRAFWRGTSSEPDGAVFLPDRHDPPAGVEREGGDGAGELAGLPDRPEQGCVPQADDPAFGPGGEDPAVRRDRQAHHVRPLGRQVERHVPSRRPRCGASRPAAP